MGEHTDYFISKEGSRRFYRRWSPEPTVKKRLNCQVLICHGYAEHSGRYEAVAELFTTLGAEVWAPDHYGHGESEGKRAVVPRFELFAEDINLLAEIIRESGSSPGLEGEAEEKLILLGHSMGGAIATATAILYPGIADGLILSGSAVRNEGGASALLRILARLIGSIAPETKVKPFDIEGISRDPEVVARYLADPLVYIDSMKAGMGKEMLRVSTIASNEKLHTIKVPALILHGGEDRLVDPECSHVLERELGSEDKSLHIFDGLYHEIFNEPEKQEVFEIISAWILSRFPAQ